MTAAERLATLHHRIQQACLAAQRPENSVTLLAVSKTFPAECVAELATLGQQSFGENYLQEAENKITRLADYPNCQNLQWHFIGPIQSNKTRPIAEYFDWVHSVDRLKVAQRLSQQRPAHLPPLNVLLQINTSGQASKSGIAPHLAAELVAEITQLPNLTLRGFMTIPAPVPAHSVNTNNSANSPNSVNSAGTTNSASSTHSRSATHETEDLRNEFLTCKHLLDTLKPHYPTLDTLSMGMSADLELAIECGSTCVRVGTALFGQRSPLHFG